MTTYRVDLPDLAKRLDAMATTIRDGGDLEPLSVPAVLMRVEPDTAPTDD